jgi:hypothetical protein
MVPPLELHKIIQKKTRGELPVIPIAKLAEELQVEKEALKEPLLILKQMQMLELDQNTQLLQLTPSGTLANLE